MPSHSSSCRGVARLCCCAVQERYRCSWHMLQCGGMPPNMFLPCQVSQVAHYSTPRLLVTVQRSRRIVVTEISDREITLTLTVYQSTNYGHCTTLLQLLHNKTMHTYMRHIPPTRHHSHTPPTLNQSRSTPATVPSRISANKQNTCSTSHSTSSTSHSSTLL